MKLASRLLVCLSLLLAGESFGVHVNGYTKKDGTQVAPYDRKGPSKSTSSSYPSSSSGSGYSGSTPVISSSPPASTDYSTSRVNVNGGSGSYSDRHRMGLGPARDSNGKIIRNEGAKHDFEKQTGYVGGRPGYVIDHIVPLKEGGCDCPENMQWQTEADAKAKDTWE